MFSLLGTLLFYDFLIAICFILCSAYERTHRNIFKYAPYIILVIVSILRYDIGADYENMYDDIAYMANHPSEYHFQHFIDDNSRTPGLKILVLLFHSFPEPSIWVIGFYSIIFLSSIYFLLDYYNAHKWGIFVLFISFLLFQSWDWIKQSASLGLIACSLVFLDRGKVKKSFYFMLLSITFHLSSIFTLPILLCRRICVSSHLMSYVLIVIFVLAELGFFNPIYNLLLQITPFYGEIYSRSQYAELSEFFYRSTSYILFSLWCIVVVFFSTKKTGFLNVLFFLGATLYMISGGSLLIDRISIYYMLPQIVIFPLIMKSKHIRVVNYIITIMILANLVLINRRFIEYGDVRGCVPYETVFSTHHNNHTFRWKE